MCSVWSRGKNLFCSLLISALYFPSPCASVSTNHRDARTCAVKSLISQPRGDYGGHDEQALTGQKYIFRCHQLQGPRLCTGFSKLSLFCWKPEGMFIVIWIISLSLSLFHLCLKKEEQDEKQDKRSRRRTTRRRRRGGGESLKKKRKRKRGKRRKRNRLVDVNLWPVTVEVAVLQKCGGRGWGRQHWAVNWWLLWPVGVALLQKREGEKGSIELCTVLAVEYVKDQLLDNRKNVFKVSWGYSVLPAWGWTSVWLLHGWEYTQSTVSHMM